ncbi:MAG: FHA domain-containing protein [Planctomycetota bacterium]
MRLVVKQKNGQAREFQFSKGPISIGRAADCQIFLRDRSVSKQHAIISVTADGKWIVEDQGSANKTFLNDKEIHKTEIKTGDCLRIIDFTIEINLTTSRDCSKKNRRRTRSCYEIRSYKNNGFLAGY